MFAQMRDGSKEDLQRGRPPRGKEAKKETSVERKLNSDQFQDSDEEMMNPLKISMNFGEVQEGENEDGDGDGDGDCDESGIEFADNEFLMSNTESELETEWDGNDTDKEDRSHPTEDGLSSGGRYHGGRSPHIGRGQRKESLGMSESCPETADLEDPTFACNCCRLGNIPEDEVGLCEGVGWKSFFVFFFDRDSLEAFHFVFLISTVNFSLYLHATPDNYVYVCFHNVDIYI